MTAPTMPLWEAAKLRALRQVEGGAGDDFMERPLDGEQWRDVPGYDGVYKVSNLGRVYSRSRVVPHGRAGTQTIHSRIMHATPDRHGYPRVFLVANGQRDFWAVHRMIMAAFEPRPDWREMQVNHKDGDPTNCRLDNLEWCTNSENRIHAYRVLHTRNHMTGKRKELHHSARPIRATCIATGEVRNYPSVSATIDDGFKPSDVGATARGRQSSHKGWRWEYTEPSPFKGYNKPVNPRIVTRFKSLDGQKFSRLLVLSTSLSPQRGGRNKAICQCRCDCGAAHSALASALQSGHVQSCGCLRNEKSRDRAIERHRALREARKARS